MGHFGKVPRREFFEWVGAASLPLLVGLRATQGAETPKRRLPLIGFIKPFQKLSFDEISDVAAEVGWTGIECPVRRGGAIEPEKVEEELPKLHEALRKRQLTLPVIATDVEVASDRLSQKVLRTASKLGIQRYRLKHYYYDLKKPIPPQLEIFRSRLRDLTELNRELNLQGGIQNHSGSNYVGAPVWDIWELVRQLDPRHLGVFFDIGHAVVEGGYSWPIEAKLMEPYFSTISVKDFLWKKADNGWRAEWCPLGEGMIGPNFFQFLKQTSFAGPVSQHFEYSLGTGAARIAAMQKDLRTLRSWLEA